MKVLLATDGSPSAAVAHEFVAAVDWPPGTEITALTVVPDYLGLYGGPAPAIAPIESGGVDAALVADAERIVRVAATAVEGAGRSAVAVVRRGRPATVIDEMAGSLGADLVIVGNRGIGGMGSLLLGSVSSEVVDHSPAPVLVVRSPRLGRVLLTVDGSGPGCRAVRLLETWPIFRHVAVRVLSVSEVRLPWWTGMTPETTSLLTIYSDAESASREQHHALVDEVVAACRAAGLHAEGTVREGIAADEILTEARDWAPDLVILGCRPKRGLERLVIGSVARDVLHHAACSVLVAREAGTA